MDFIDNLTSVVMSLCAWCLILSPLLVAVLKTGEKKMDKGEVPFFPVLFGILCGICGYLIAPTGLFLKSGAALSLALIGFLVVVFLQFLLRLIFKNNDAIIIIIEIILFIVMAVFTFTRKNAEELPKSHDSDFEPQGFTDSNGEFHPYIPEFGKDVNDWMADNW